MKGIIVFLIKVYQMTLSPDHGWLKSWYPYGYCKYYPSCSEYTKQAVVKHGSLKGVRLGVVRVLKCNPWTESKVDIVPN